MSELTYCYRCWSDLDSWLGRDRITGRCCTCQGGRARAARVVAAIKREQEWAIKKERLKEESLALFMESDDQD